MRFSALLMVAASTGGVSALLGERDDAFDNKANVAVKFKRPPPKNASARNDTDDPNNSNVGSWPLTFHKSAYGHRFTVPVHLGEPPQRFDLDVHTGVAATWVLGESPVTSGAWPVMGKSAYVPGNSSEHVVRKDGYQNFQLRYPDETTVQGTVYRDRVRIGDGEDSIGYWVQELGVAKTIHTRFASDDSFVGVLGLGDQRDRGVRVPRSVLRTVAKTTNMRSWKFSMVFKEEGGHMDWGWRNESRYTGKLFRTWFSRERLPKRMPPAYHLFNISAFAFGDKPMKTKVLSAALDSASSYIVLPYYMAAPYYEALGKGSSPVVLPAEKFGWEVPCMWDLPDFTVQVTNYTTNGRTAEEKFWKLPLSSEHQYQAWKNYTIPGELLRLQRTKPADNVRGTPDMCLGAIVTRQAPAPDPFLGVPIRPMPLFPDVILGWPFLKNKFVEISKMDGIQIGEAS